MMEERHQELPNQWKWASLAELVVNPSNAIVDGPFGSNLKASEYQSCGVPIIRLQNIDRNKFIRKNIKFITRKKAEELKRHSFWPGDIAITKLGDPLGKATIIPEDFESGIIVADVVRVRTNPNFVNKEYLSFAINSPNISQQLIKDTKGTTRPRVNLKHIRGLKVPLAPLNEQKQIVDKIERLFSDLDEGEALLKTIQKQLATYRQSVLKAAVTGELTKDWREANKHRLESGEDLLKRILKTRRESWNGRGKYKESTPPDITNLPRLPEGWVWVNVSQLIAEPLTNGRSVPDSNSGFPVLRITALKNGTIDLNERKIGAWSEEDAKPYLVRFEDFFLSRGNGSKKFVGKGGLIEKEPDPIAFPDTLIRIRLNKLINKEFFSQIWNSYFLREQIEGKARTTAGIYKINQSDVGSFVLPLPPVHEQVEINQILNEKFSQIEALEKWCETELARSQALRQSILKDAFSGKLVAQDPNDEPASELLKRIQAEKEGQPSPKSREKAKGRKNKKTEAA